MAETKFTPGNWKFKPYPQDDTCTAGWVETDEEPICRVENIGDGNLLAAAPAMFKAIADFVREFETNYVNSEGEIVDNPGLLLCVNYHNFKKILSDARGETKPLNNNQ